MNVSSEFLKLKTRVAGNEQKHGFEHTFRQPTNEKYNITGMTKWNRRILSELEFAIHLSESRNGEYDGIIHSAILRLSDAVDKDGTLTDVECAKAEEVLLPLEKAAKEYTAILVAHAHIDMNWKWGYDETVAITLATFRTMLNIMNEYPDFCFSQSQASVYKIVEEHDPEMMEEIKARIAEGRWEVTATAWVEPDKNMPSAESLLRHIACSREYLSRVWGVRDFEIDFVPDTFGHSANVPEINSFGGVKYYYHCRGLSDFDYLYRFRAPSGKEVLMFREPNWYNASVTEHIGSTLIKISKQCSGIKTLPVLYGVGDHGGGPTRRDIERALEITEWRIYPTLRFGKLLDFFKEAEKIRDTLPVINRELNFAFPGCYTTQSRIKRANRRLESSLYSAESIAALASNLTDFKFDKKRITSAWRKLLFNHFHDIITGSCVPESREHAMSLYQTASADVNTQMTNAMRKIGLAIDTSSIEEDIPDSSTAQGAGVGYGVKNFIGVPSTERGIGKTRIFHIFNTLPYKRRDIVELTVWDWVGDIDRIGMEDAEGNPIPCQVIDREQQPYWDHRFIRVMCEAEVGALGYTTVVLKEKELVSYPSYTNPKDRMSVMYDDIVLENDNIRAVIDASSARIISLTDKTNGKELIDGSGAGFTFIETECKTSDAWNIGRYIRPIPVDRCISLKKTVSGPLFESVTAEYDVFGSPVKAVYSLDKYSKAVKITADIDWRHHGMTGDSVPVLNYRVPLSCRSDEYLYGIPAGNIKRPALSNDVPAIKYGMADRLMLMSDSKYGYRATGDALTLTLINSSVKPDRYPEIGAHCINIYVGVCDQADAERFSQSVDVPLIYQPSNSHGGTLPMNASLLCTDGENVTVSAVVPTESGFIVRFYETMGVSADVKFTLCKNVKSAKTVDLSGNETGKPVKKDKNTITVTSEPYVITAVEIEVL